MKRCLSCFFAVSVVLACAPVFSGTYIHGVIQNLPNIITHPLGYDGTGGTLEVSLCIDPIPTSPGQTANDMVVPLQNIVVTFNQRQWVIGNLQSGTAFDFESVALHEVGHAIGLAHVNLASESGLGGADQDYTKTDTGVDGSYDLGIGADGRRGSPDDLRDDDRNFHWFNVGVNDPFTIAGVIDTTTYSNSLADLPVGDTFVSNAGRDVGSLPRYSAPNTEAIMQQGTFFNETQRQMAADEVATLALAETGLDETPGTADDYTLKLLYAGITVSCDIVLDWNVSVLFAGTLFSGSGVILSANHRAMASVSIRFNPNSVFGFTSVPAADIAITKGPAIQDIPLGSTASFDIAVQNLGTSALQNVTVSDPLAPDCDRFFATLAVSATQNYACELTNVTAAFTNQIDVSAEPDGGGFTINASDTADVTINAVPAPNIAITKGPANQQALSGSDVTFDIDVVNTGNTTLDNVTVSDPLTSDCDASLGTLGAGASSNYSCTAFNVTSDFTNAASVTGDVPGGGQVSDNDSANVDVINPSIQISKGPDDQQVPPGSDADFDISVENTGDVPLTGVVVSDLLTPDCNNNIGNLAAAEVVNYSCTATNVTADFTNTASVSGTPPLGPDVTDNDTASVEAVDPDAVFSNGFETPAP